MLDRALIIAQLARAERQVVRGERHLSLQRALIADLSRDGRDTVAAGDLLQAFQQSQVMFVAQRDRLRAEVADAK